MEITFREHLEETYSPIYTTLFVCVDCFTVVSGDTTSFDYYYSPEEGEAKIKAISACLDDLTRKHGYVTNGNEDTIEFSTTPCECCNSSLGGLRASIIFLKEQS